MEGEGKAEVSLGGDGSAVPERKWQPCGIAEERAAAGLGGHGHAGQGHPWPQHWNAEGDSGVNFLLLLQSLSQLWTSRLRISQFYILLQNETAGMDPQYLAKRAVVQYWNRISLAWKAERKNASSGVGGLLEL
ncbi:uncharacterized protein ATXN1 isoform X2 [Gallus gallus]|uniref:uncharacterized protein ATXN1 isoform X2 n=1 Tax=Gallus gallus TaxID=9031 RepID=UPI001F029DFB|nr:uncharacterized protein ATXN1 isoform X2 [Gallus gallus]